MVSANTLGVLLAGGKSRRMGGGDKCLLKLGKKTILQHVIDRASPQVSDLLLNVNGDADRFDQYNLPVASDQAENFAGPLAGVLTGLEWSMKHRPNCKWLVTFPADTPFFPMDLASKLYGAVTKDGVQLACAASGDRRHPVFGIWPVSLYDQLKKAVIEDGVRKIDEWTSCYNLKVVKFKFKEVDPFFNINRPEDLKWAEKLF